MGSYLEATVRCSQCQPIRWCRTGVLIAIQIKQIWHFGKASMRILSLHSRNQRSQPLKNSNWCIAHQLLLAFQEEHKCVHCQGLEELLSSHFYKHFFSQELVYILISIRRILYTQNNNVKFILANGNRHIPCEKLITIDSLNISLSAREVKNSNLFFLRRKWPPQSHCQCTTLFDLYGTGLGYNSEHWLCSLLAGVSLALPLKSKVTSTIVGPRYISPTAKDCNNDAFAPHSAPFALSSLLISMGQ